MEVERLLYEYLERDFNFYFWRTHTGREVDLILARNPNDEPRAIEIKSVQTPDAEDLSDLLAFKAVYPNAHLYCICQTKLAYQKNGIDILPWKAAITEVLK